jgi:hypothetical protein
MECFSPWGSVKGTWREAFLSGDPEGYLEKALRRALLFIGALLLGNLEEGSSTGDFESWMKGLWEWGIALSRGLRGRGLREGSFHRET